MRSGHRLAITPPKVPSPASSTAPPAVAAQRETVIASWLGDVERRNGRWYDDEVTKLERWADDLKLGLERELRELDRALTESRKASTGAATLAEKLAAQKRTCALETERNRKRRYLFTPVGDLLMRTRRSVLSSRPIVVLYYRRRRCFSSPAPLTLRVKGRVR